MVRRTAATAFALTTLTLAACGGGGSSAGSGTPVVPPGAAASATPTPAATATATPTATPTPTASPTSLSVSGSAAEFSSGVALSGFTVVVGALPNNATCSAAQTATSNPCGVPASPQAVATTSSTGAFTIAVPAAGTYMLTIGKDSTYATLHRAVTVGATSLALGTLKIAALSSDEQAWVSDVNDQRATVSSPASFPNLVVDEYAEEQARAEVAAIVTGVQPYGDATESLYAKAYFGEPGSLYSVNGVADLVAAPSGFLQADAAWMTGEKSNCPGGNWQTCTVAENTGHYINISTTNDIWIGLGESIASFNDPPYGNEWAYAMLLPALP